MNYTLWIKTSTLTAYVHLSSCSNVSIIDVLVNGTGQIKTMNTASTILWVDMLETLQSACYFQFMRRFQLGMWPTCTLLQPLNMNIQYSRECSRQMKHRNAEKLSQVFFLLKGWISHCEAPVLSLFPFYFLSGVCWWKAHSSQSPRCISYQQWRWHTVFTWQAL